MNSNEHTLAKNAKVLGGLQEKSHGHLEVNGGFAAGFSGAKTLNKADFPVIWAIHLYNVLSILP